MLVPIQMGTKMAAGNQQKHLSLSFATKKSVNLSLQEIKNVTIIFFFLLQELFTQPKSPK